MKQLSVDSRHGDSLFAIEPSDNINALMLDGADASITVPAGAGYAVFAATDDFYMKLGSAAAIPGADITNGTGSELNPTVRRVAPGDVIHCIGAAGVVTISFYS